MVEAWEREMEADIKLGKVWGIPIGLNSSWFLIFVLITWSLAVGYLPNEYPELGTISHWVLGTITAVLFFASVVLHELGHAYLAIRNAVPVRSITLFIFGGVAQIEKQPETAGAEFRIAAAGPLVSVLLAAIFGAVWLVSRNVLWLAAPTLWLARINLILALFNLIPGFPLDGGRILRAIVWKMTNLRRANRVAMIVGQFVALAFIAVGIVLMFAGNFFNGLWLIFIGWFLRNAATASFAQANIEQVLRGVPVERVMAQQWEQVSGRMPLSTLLEEKVLHGGPRQYFVMQDGYGVEEVDHPHGMLTMTDVTRVPRAQWGVTPAGKIMVAWEDLVTVTPATPLLEALRLMTDRNINQAPVVENGRLVGLLTREHVLRYVRLSSELDM
jgi:Zn-dependent protease